MKKAVHILHLALTALIVYAAPGAAQGDSPQQARSAVEGTVFDTVSGRPIPFAVVSVADTTISALAGYNGRYRILVPAGERRLEFRKIGYRMRSIDLRVTGDAIFRDAFMEPLPIGLATIVVTAEADDPALRIIRQAIARKNDLLARINDYRYDAYVKFVVRDLNKPTDSADAVVLITETLTSAYWEQPDKYQEVIQARRQSTNLDAERNLVSVGQIVNFNRNRIDMAKYSVVSPTADDALNHYDYYMLDTLSVDGRTVFRLAIEPKSSANPLFVGMIEIADSTFDVLTVDVGANQAIRFEFFRNLRYSQHLKDLGDEHWMPYEIRFSGEFHIGIPIPGFPQHVSFEHIASLEDFRFDEGNPPSTLGEFLIVVDDDADDSDSASWDERRAVPLTNTEQGAYTRIDSIQSLPPSFGRRVLTGFGTAVFLSTNRDFFRFSRTEGVYLGAGITYRDLSPNVTLRGKVGYAFSAEDWQYLAGAQFRLSERQRLWVGGAYGDEIVRRPTAVSSTYNPTFLALLSRLDPLNYYNQRGFTVSASTKLVNFTRLRVQYNDFDQSSVPVVTDFAIFGGDRLQRPNPPIVDGKLRSVSATLSFDSRPLLKSKGRDYFFNTFTYTRITLGVEYASPDFINNDFDFTRLVFRLYRRQRTLNMGLTTIDAYAGTGTSGLPPQRYFTVDFGKGAFFEEGGFNTMNEVNFAGNRAALIVVRHEFDQLLFRKSGLPLFKKIPFTLTVHGGAFWTDFVNHNPNPGDEFIPTAPTAYTEIGFGLANLTPFISPFNFGIYFNWQLSSYETEGFRFRIGIPSL